VSPPEAFTEFKKDLLKKDLFCINFVGRGVNETNLDLAEKAMANCDGYALYSTYDDPSHNMFKIMDHAPANKKDATWEFALKMWTKVAEQGIPQKYKWIAKVDTDAFMRADKLRLALSHHDSDKSKLVARPGRHSLLPVVGSVHALSGPLVTELMQTKDALTNPQQYLRDDRLLSNWVNKTNAVQIKAINDVDGCTTFGSVDGEDLPTTEEIEALGRGVAYRKKFAAKKNKPDLGEICYSPDLAVLHPIKDRALYLRLIQSLS
jgi:hypothetical protein